MTDNSASAANDQEKKTYLVHERPAHACFVHPLTAYKDTTSVLCFKECNDGDGSTQLNGQAACRLHHLLLPLKTRAS